MSFSSDIKKELCVVRDLPPNEMRAMLYGLFYAGQTVGERTVIRSESAELVAAARTLSECVFPKARFETTRLVRTGGSVYTYGIKSGAEEVNRLFGDFSGISPSAVSGTDEESGAFLRGVFISCGYVTDPRKEYHLELVLPDSTRAMALNDFINEHGVAVKTTVRQRRPRNGGIVIYAKESEVIEDFLTFIGAVPSSLEIMQIKIEKSFRNRVNRRVNCETANLDRTVNAAGRCCEDIELIFKEKGADLLKPELRETALLRLENPEASLSELCELSGGTISKSGLAHRLRKLSELADGIRNEKQSLR